MIDTLGEKPTLEELKRAFKRAKRLKSPSTSGISVDFFQKINDKNLEVLRLLLDKAYERLDR
jgi:hypothetical protein